MTQNGTVQDAGGVPAILACRVMAEVSAVLRGSGGVSSPLLATMAPAVAMAAAMPGAIFPTNHVLSMRR